MSYESESKFTEGTTLKQIREIVSLLGYVKVNDGLKVPNRTDCMMWSEAKEYKSWVGVELNIYKENRKITVTTRSRVGRSYWDLTHQNKTIKTLRDLFGGHFITDAGKNRYWRPEHDAPSPIMSGCFLARWRFNNSLIKPRVYLMQRGMGNKETKLTGMFVLDDMNPRLFSNNLLIPYLVAIWEEYLKSSFVVLLQYSDKRHTALKRAKISQGQLEAIASGEQTVENSLAESLSFQRPSKVTENFKLIDPKMDLSGVLKKPYRRRKVSLFDSIEECIELRNEIVHTGQMDITISDEKVEKFINDFEVAIDRIYDLFGARYNFFPSRNF